MNISKYKYKVSKVICHLSAVLQLQKGEKLEVNALRFRVFLFSQPSTHLGDIQQCFLFPFPYQLAFWSLFFSLTTTPLFFRGGRAAVSYHQPVVLCIVFVSQQKWVADDQPYEKDRGCRYLWFLACPVPVEAWHFLILPAGESPAWSLQQQQSCRSSSRPACAWEQ